VCCGGILGLGEAAHDRVGLLHVLATLPSHPESVPINALVSVEGTPLSERLDIDKVNCICFDWSGRFLKYDASS